MKPPALTAITTIVYNGHQARIPTSAMSVAVRVGAIPSSNTRYQQAVFRNVADFVEFANAYLMGEAFSVKTRPSYEFGKGQAAAESDFDIVNFQVIPHEALDETVRQIQKAVVKMRLGESEPGSLLPDSEDFAAAWEKEIQLGRPGVGRPWGQPSHKIVYWAEFTPTQVQRCDDPSIPSHWGRTWRPVSGKERTNRYFAVIQADTQQPFAGLRSCILIKKLSSDYLVPEKNTCTSFSRFPERCELRLRVAMEMYLHNHMLKLPLDKNPERRAKLDAIFKEYFREQIKLKLGESAASDFGFKPGEWPFSQAIFAAEITLKSPGVGPGVAFLPPSQPAYVIVSVHSEARIVAGFIQIPLTAGELVFTGAVYVRSNGRWKAASHLMRYKFPAEALEQCRRWIQQLPFRHNQPVPLPVDADAERARRFRAYELAARKAQVLAQLGT